MRAVLNRTVVTGDLDVEQPRPRGHPEEVVVVAFLDRRGGIVAAGNDPG